ncbi:MAG: LacI family DNA-binding transcriptional regulator, partial [Nocardioides sp.]
LAYHQALDGAGVTPDPELFVRVPWGAEPGAQAMGSLLSLREPPTAVFAHSDEAAMGALRTIRRAGLTCPDDVSVIGVDDHPLAAELDLTTIRQEVFQQGELAATLLTETLSGGPSHSSALLPTRLVVRGSTGRPRAGVLTR